MSEKTTLQFDTDHGAMIAYALWFSLGEALRQIGSTRGNDGWKENLYDTCLQYVENMTEIERYGNPERLQSLDKFRSEEAKKAAIDAITAAFDRVKYVE